MWKYIFLQTSHMREKKNLFEKPYNLFYGKLYKAGNLQSSLKIKEQAFLLVI